MHQVDSLVSRVRAHLRSVGSGSFADTDPDVTDPDVAGLTRADLDPALLQSMAGGYRHDEVEKYLAEASETIAPNDDDRAAALELLFHPVFHRPRFHHPGYWVGGVSSLIGLIQRVLQGDLEMTRADLEDVSHVLKLQVHEATRDQVEVDAYLRAVGAELDRRASGTSGS